MKSMQQISRACDLANTSDLARLARLVGATAQSSYLRKAMYADEDAAKIIDAYWKRRNITVIQRGAVQETTILK